MKERETFIAYGDLLRDLANQCRAAERFLRQIEARDMPAGQDAFAGWVADTEHSIAESLEQCAGDGPAKLVQRRLQYKPEHHVWTTPEDLNSGLRQLMEVNGTVAAVLQEETDKSVPIEIGEQMQDLTRQVRAINRQVSLSLVTAEDL